MNLAHCRWGVVEEAARALHLDVSHDDSADWDVAWTDTSVSEERVMRLKRHQRINHFAGCAPRPPQQPRRSHIIVERLLTPAVSNTNRSMSSLARKTHMAKTLGRVAESLPEVSPSCAAARIAAGRGSRARAGAQEFGFMPRSFCLPADERALRAHAWRSPGAWSILNPTLPPPYCCPYPCPYCTLTPSLPSRFIVKPDGGLPLPLVLSGHAASLTPY